MSRIAKDTYVTLKYQVTDPDGTLIDPGEEELGYVHGGYDGIFFRIEEALEGKEVGESVTVKLQPAEAFGEYDPELVQVESVEALPQPLEVGMMIEGAPEGEPDEAIFYRVTEIAEDRAVLDGNHPLAGMALVFNCTVSGIRPATPEELSAAKEH